jgi:hypothetical protein
MLNAPEPPVDRSTAGLERGSNGDATGGRWLTYAQAGDLLGVSTEAARQLAKRRKWPRQTPNERNAPALILVPLDTAVRPRTPVASPVEQRQPGNEADTAAHDRADDHTLVALLDRAVEMLREQLTTANTRADAAETDRRVAQARADHADAERDAQQARSDAAEVDRRAAITLADQSVALLTEAAARADRAEADRRAAEAAREAERARAEALRDRLNAQLVAAETTEAHTAALRDRLDAMQSQLTQAHAALQAATETERRAGQAEAGREAERSRADALRDRIEAMREQLTARQEVVDAAEAIRQADDRRLKLSRWARLRAAWRSK